MRTAGVLSWSLFKIFWRDRTSVFFTFLMPVIITAIFGLLNFGGSVRVNVGVADEARNPASERIVETLRRVDTLRVTAGTPEDELRALRRGERDLVLVFPADFPADFAPNPRGTATITAYENAGRPDRVGVGRAVLTRVIDEISFAALGAQPIARIERESVDARNLTYVDFLIPGMIAFSVMQLGVFSVAFGIVQHRAQGVLRRLLATPLRPTTLLAAHTLVRLVNVVIQVVVLLGMGVLFFGYRPLGTFPELLVASVLGGVMFLTFGFAIAGRARSEDQAAPLAQLVTLPQAFLSGVWFPRDALPGWLRPITDYFPLTFLADATREIGTQGAHLWDVGVQVLGLAVWAVLGFVLAARLFRVE